MFIKKTKIMASYPQNMCRAENTPCSIHCVLVNHRILLSSSACLRQVVCIARKPVGRMKDRCQQGTWLPSAELVVCYLLIASLIHLDMCCTGYMNKTKRYIE